MQRSCSRRATAVQRSSQVGGSGRSRLAGALGARIDLVPVEHAAVKKIGRDEQATPLARRLVGAVRRDAALTSLVRELPTPFGLTAGGDAAIRHRLRQHLAAVLTDCKLGTGGIGPLDRPEQRRCYGGCDTERERKKDLPHVHRGTSEDPSAPHEVEESNPCAARISSERADGPPHE